MEWEWMPKNWSKVLSTHISSIENILFVYLFKPQGNNNFHFKFWLTIFGNVVAQNLFNIAVTKQRVCLVHALIYQDYNNLCFIRVTFRSFVRNISFIKRVRNSCICVGVSLKWSDIMDMENLHISETLSYIFRKE